jgi:hypothetical protein
MTMTLNLKANDIGTITWNERFKDNHLTCWFDDKDGNTSVCLSLDGNVEDVISAIKKMLATVIEDTTELTESEIKEERAWIAGWDS